jgi:hypothetical protein
VKDGEAPLRQAVAAEQARRAKRGCVESSDPDRAREVLQVLNLVNGRSVLDDAVEAKVTRLARNAKTDAVARTRECGKQCIEPRPRSAFQHDVEVQTTDGLKRVNRSSGLNNDVLINSAVKERRGGGVVSSRDQDKHGLRIRKPKGGQHAGEKEGISDRSSFENSDASNAGSSRHPPLRRKSERRDEWDADDAIQNPMKGRYPARHGR